MTSWDSNPVNSTSPNKRRFEMLDRSQKLGNSLVSEFRTWIEARLQWCIVSWENVTYRVHTYFFQTFSQNNNFFSRLNVIKQAINIALKKAGTKLFSLCTVNVRGQDWIRFDKNNKKIHLKSNCCFENTQTFYHVPDFISIFQTFSRSGKLLGKFQDFFQECKSLYEPWS